MEDNEKTDVASSSHLIEIIIATSVGLAAGYLTKKIVVGRSENVFRKLAGSVLQVGVTTAIAQHPEVIRSFSQYIFHHFSRKKKIIPVSRGR